MAALASFALIMAVNTAFVASSELMERVAHRYGFHWIIATNRRQSLYRIHIANAIFFSIIILITSGKPGRPWRTCMPWASWPASPSTWGP